MQITLNQDEILVAIETYVRSQINIADNQEISIDLKAGRGENGYSATLDIRPARSIKITKPTSFRGLGETASEVTPMVASAPVADESKATDDDVDEAVEETQEEASTEAEEPTEEAPAEKPTSIFNFNKPA